MAFTLLGHSGAGRRPEPGIHNPNRLLVSLIFVTACFVSMDSGLAAARRPGMTKERLPLAMLNEPVYEPAALLKLGDRDPLVGLVRLIDIAWPAHHGRDAGLREQPTLGAVGDLAVVVAAGQAFREQRHLGVERGGQGRG